jgi:hypothetical protein
MRVAREKRQVAIGDFIVRCHDDDPLDDVAQLANVAGPSIHLQPRHRTWRDGFRALAFG